MFKDILIAVTPSEICDHAADAAFGFAKRFDAKLHLVHVCGMVEGWGQMEHLDASGATERIKAEISKYYQDKLAGVPDHKISVVPGIPHNEILRLARKDNADLIIMGPHTKEYAERRSKMWGMAGSTLERVAQKARCPVMIVNQEAATESGRFRNIVVATDFSEQAECAVGYGSQLARHHKSKLTVFNCIDDENLTQSEIAERIAKAKERMQKEFSRLLGGLDNVALESWEGKPAMEILKLARQSEAGIILMAHHTREKDPEKAYLGSTVAQVAMNATCPTMSINRHFDLRCGLMYDQTGGVADTKQASS